jgi:triosephosphate isomerase
MPDRRPIVSGNWKMNLNHFEAIQLVQKLHYELADHGRGDVEVTVHPPFTDIRSVQTVIDADRIDIVLGAQNCHWEDSGAFTGEVSPAMLAKLSCTYVIVGHSERRQLFGEDDGTVNRKARAVLRHGMQPIVCVGETIEQRDAGQAESVVAEQLRGSLAGLSADELASSVVAYEPVWAIGTGRVASPQDAQSMCALVRTVVDGLRAGTGERVRVQYGGSVKPVNATELLGQPDIDGALVGGASLEAADFARIVAAAGQAVTGA